jgi:hypothetical protein
LRISFEQAPSYQKFRRRQVTVDAMSTLNFLRSRTKEYLARKGYWLRRIDDLTQLADRVGSDKGTRYSGHLYTRVYRKFFQELRDSEIAFLEIGLLRVDADRRRAVNAVEGTTAAVAVRAPSLEMWRAYFPRAQLFGFDIDDFSKVEIDDCTIIRGDMSSPSDLARLVAAAGRQFDVIIDDGSHASHHQQIALGYLFPHVRSGGLYIIEDLHWQDDHLEKAKAPKTRDMLRRLQAGCDFETPFLFGQEQAYIQTNLDGIWLFDSLTTVVDDAADALAILRKK